MTNGPYRDTTSNVDARSLFKQGYRDAIAVTETQECMPFHDLFRDFAGCEPSVLERAELDCDAFVDRAHRLLERYGPGWRQAGSDFWYARHGVDFSYVRGPIGNALYDIATSFGPVAFRLSNNHKVEPCPS